MAAQTFRLRELLFNTEASFLENVLSPGSLTYAKRIPVLDATCTVEQSKEPDASMQSRKNVSKPGFNGMRQAKVDFTTWLPGLVTDPAAGSPTATWFTDLCSIFLSSLLTDDGGTVSSAVSGSSITTTGVTAITPGTIIWGGAKGDGRADGQPGVVSTYSAGALALLTALPGTPASPDVIKVGANFYPNDTNPTGSVRMLCGHALTGAQWHLTGGQLDSISFDIDLASGRPIKVKWSFKFAYWDRNSFTIPSSVAAPDSDTAPIAGGSLFCQTVGTATRAVESTGSLTLTINLGLIAQMGQAAGQAPYCNITGWVQDRFVPTVQWTIPWTSQAETDWDADGVSTVMKHILFANNVTPGRRFAFYLANAYPSGMRPTYNPQGELLYVTKTYTGTESSVTTSELTRSCFRFAIG